MHESSAKQPALVSDCRCSCLASLDEATWLVICSYFFGRHEGCTLSFISKTWRARVEVMPQFVSALLVPPAVLAEADNLGDDFSGFDTSEFYGDLGRVEDFSHTQKIEAKIQICNKLVGKCDLVLIDLRRPLNFHEACDAPSADLQSVGVKFCNRHGAPRIASVKAALEGQARLGFLYIDDFVLHRCELEHKNTRADIGAAALRSLLQETALSGRWHLAVYVPDGSAQSNETRCKGAWSARCRGHEKYDQHELEDLAELDARQFMQAGFKQAKELVAASDCYHFFATPSFLHEVVLPFSEVVNIPILRKPSVENLSQELNSKDAALLEIVKNAMSPSLQSIRAEDMPLSAAVKSQFERLVIEGATLETSRVMHCCAAHLHTDCFEFLAGMPSVALAINAKDENGVTPLMCAASTGAASKCISFCARLIECRADTNIQDLSGRTALGHARSAWKSSSDFECTFGLQRSQERPECIANLERMLMPQEGPTDADEAFSESNSDDDMDDFLEESSDEVDLEN